MHLATMRWPVLFLLVILCGFLGAQPPQAVAESLRNAVGELRQHVLSQPNTDALALETLLQRLDTAKLGAWSSDQLVGNAWFANLIRARDFAQYFKWAAKKTKPYPLASSFSEADYATLGTNHELVGLLLAGFLEAQYPFPVQDTLFATEIFQILDLAPGMRIAEIGAGNGQLGLLAAMMYDSLEVYSNELDQGYVVYQQKILPSYVPRFAPGSRFEIVQGKKRSARLEGKELDLIFLQNTFHHFADRGDMLASLKASLRKGGQLILIEEELGRSPSPFACPDLMHRSSIIPRIEKAGFTHTGTHEMMDGESVILFFRYGE